VHPENYMGSGGPPHHYLERIRERYPLSLHGVGLSIGGVDPLDQTHLARLKGIADRYEPGLFSEHLAWSTHEGAYLGDLLPLPYTEETLIHVAAHVDEAQGVLSRRMVRDAVWRLYAHAIGRSGPVPTLIEWDSNIPEWPVLFTEARRAERIMQDRRTNHACRE
jgi:uncharacterized protein (UPF0276 family)